ncbi:unnamed protein product [Clonostachys chloroleuca]|uniref:Zn(2)-C6 fungal-type domain-containing protein n=1 Tax=Clonostachys chloroleuca TaxID=1926264 RepID=A0AA35LWN1_9HYPO|nr:unnamed protein product [Clonostachys chloroleuca]
MGLTDDQPTPEAAVIGTRQLPRPNRQRASIACLHCRNRKIRCDVSRRGYPCANCRLDDTECEVVGRSSSRTSKRRKDSLVASLEENPPTADTSSMTYPTDSLNTMPIVWESSSPTEILARDETATSIDVFPSCEVNTLALGPLADTMASSTSITPTIQFRRSSDSRRKEGRSDVFYTYHPFLSRNELSHLSPRDLNLLDSQSCLRVPTRPILHEFIRQYFLYIHPLLPMMDEALFWRIYRGEDGPNEHISLLLIQAMLFVSCNICPGRILPAGEGSTPTLATHITICPPLILTPFQILYDMNSELSSFTISQAALLLTSWTPPANPRGMKPNTQWLSIAIEHARAEGAHLYSRHQGPMSESPSSHQALAKRIWWCCIIRDRLLSLGVRRRIQIDRESFDFDSNRRLNHSDLAGEVDGSGVYCKKAKMSLIRILLRIVDLCVSLTDLLNLAHRLEFSRNGDSEQWLPHLQQVRTVKEALRMWHEVTKSEFSCSLKQLRSASKYDEQCKAVAVQLHVMYMYYHSAGIAIAHYEILLTTMVIPTGTPYTILRPSYLSKLFRELQDASEDLSDCLDGLIKEDLIPLLPISTIALIVFPLIHHSLDLYTTHDDSYTAKVLRKSRLDALTEAMNKFEQTYDGVEWVKSILRQVIDLGESRLSEGTRDREWRRNLSSSPAPYLRIAFTIEFSLSRSYFFQEADAPAYLKTVFKDTSPIMGRAEPTLMLQPVFGMRDTEEALDEDWEKLLQLQSPAEGPMLGSESTATSVATPMDGYHDFFDLTVREGTL